MLLFYFFYNINAHTYPIGLQTLAAGFLTIAKGLINTKLRADYRHRLLSLCSDVSLATESKSGG